MLESAIQDTRRWWNREDLILLVLLGILLYLPGISRIALFDRDEPRFTTAAREMVATGDYIVPRFNGNLRPDKPPLCYWLMAAGYELTGGPSELGARLPSAICSTLTLIVLYFAVGMRFGRITGLLAALLLGSTSLFIVESRLATADATMILFIMICMACAWQAWDAASTAQPTGLPRTDNLQTSSERASSPLDTLGRRRITVMPRWMALIFWISLALGALAKGVPLFFVLFPMIVLSFATGTLPQELKRWKSHFHLTGIRVALALAVACITLFAVTFPNSFPAFPDLRLWSIILAVLLLGMILAPGLPGVALRCCSGGNWRWWRSLCPLMGIPILILLVGWWVIAAGILTDWKLIRDMVGIHFLQRAFGPLLKLFHITITDTGGPGGNDPMKSYGWPPGAYLLLVWGTFWPWSVLLIPAGYHAVRRLLGRTALSIDPRPYQFLIAWIVPTWIALELARGKLPHYPLPTYIPLAILCADALVQSWHRMTDVLAAHWFSSARWVVTLIWIALGSVVITAASFSSDLTIFWYAFVLAGALAALGAASALSWNRPSWPFVVILGFGAVLLIADTLILPELPSIRVSKTLGERITAVRAAEPQYHVAFCGYDEPSVVFYAGTRVEDGSLEHFITQVGFAPAVPPRTPYLAVIDEKTRQSLDDRKLTYYILRHITGIDTGNLKPVDVFLIANIPPRDYALPTSTHAASSSQPATNP